MKSCYWLQNQITNSQLKFEASVMPSLNHLKSEVWSLKTSPKIKTFIWKMLSESLPVADKIVSRGMKVDSRCRFSLNRLQKFFQGLCSQIFTIF